MGINFSDFAITCSIYSKMYDEFNASKTFSKKWGILLIKQNQLSTSNNYNPYGVYIYESSYHLKCACDNRPHALFVHVM